MHKSKNLMKRLKTITILCVVSMILGMLSIPVSAANTLDFEPVFADFDTSAEGFPDWVNTVWIDDEHGNSYQPNGSWHTNVWNSKILDTKSGIYQWSFDFYIGENSYVSMLLTSEGNPLLSLSDFIYSSENKTLEYYTPTLSNSWEKSSVAWDIPTNTWVKVDQLFDLDNEKVYCYIDGALAFEKTICFGVIDSIKNGTYSIGGLLPWSVSGTTVFDNFELKKYEKNDFYLKDKNLNHIVSGTTSVDIQLKNSVNPDVLKTDAIKVKKYHTSDIFMKNGTDFPVKITNASQRSFTLKWNGNLESDAFYAIDVSGIKGFLGNTFQNPVKIMMPAPSALEPVTDMLVPVMDFENLDLEDGTQTAPGGIKSWDFWSDTPRSGEIGNVRYYKQQANGNTMLKVDFNGKKYAVSTEKFRPAQESGTLTITTDIAIASETGAFFSISLNDMSKNRSDASSEYRFIQTKWTSAWMFNHANGELGKQLVTGTTYHLVFDVDLATRVVKAKIGSSEYTLTTIPEDFDLMSDNLYYTISVEQDKRAVCLDNISVSHAYEKSAGGARTDSSVAMMDFEDFDAESTMISPEDLHTYSFWGEDGVLNQSVPVKEDVTNVLYSSYDDNGNTMLQLNYADKGLAVATNPLNLATASGKLVITTDMAYANRTDGQIFFALDDMSESRANRDAAEYRILAFTWGDGWMNNHHSTQLQWPCIGDNGATTKFVIEIDLATREVNAMINGTHYGLANIPESLDLMSDNLCYVISSDHMGKIIRVDNISVTHSYEVASQAPFAGGVTFEDHYGNFVANGETVSPDVTKIKIPMSTGISEADIKLSLTDSKGNPVEYTGKLQDNIYTIVTTTLLKENETYTLTLGDFVSNSGAYTFQTSAGSFIISDLKFVSGNGEAITLVADASSFAVSANVSNSGGTEQLYFIITTYQGSEMREVFVRTGTITGNTQAGTITTPVITPKLEQVDTIRAHAWSIKTPATPLCDYAEIR